MDSAIAAQGVVSERKNSSKPPRLSLVNVSPLMIINVATSPVLTVGFASATLMLTGSNRNCDIALWSLDPATSTSSLVQKVTITRTSSPVRSFRSTFIRRIVDGACSLALFESRSHDAVIIPISEKKGLMNGAVLFRVNHPVLSVSGDYDLDRDRLVCHVVDVDSIEDLDVPGDVAFGSIASLEIRNSIRRASKRAESLASAERDIPNEWSDSKGCCTIS